MNVKGRTYGEIWAFHRKHLPPEPILCNHAMHCCFCDKGYYSLVAGEKHQARCPRRFK